MDTNIINIKMPEYDDSSIYQATPKHYVKFNS